MGKSVVSKQKKIALSPCRSSFETDFALGWFLDVDGWNLVSDRDRENSLGVERGEREGNVVKGASKCWECLHCEGWGRMICAGHWGFVWSWISGWGCGWLLLIFSSLVMSSQSLLFKFVIMAISSDCSSGLLTLLSWRLPHCHTRLGRRRERPRLFVLGRYTRWP